MRALLAYAAIACAGGMPCAQGQAEEIPPPPTENLSVAWATAMEVDMQLAAACSESQARAAALAAAHSLRMPTAKLETSLLMRDNEPAFLIDASSLGAGVVRAPYLQREEFAGRASLRVPLYTGWRISHEIAAADSDLAGAQFATSLQTLDLKLLVAAEYVEVLRSAKHVDVAKHQLEHLSAHAADVHRQFELGRVRESDFLSVDVLRAEAEIDSLRAKNRLNAARHAYNRRMARPLDAPVRLAALRLPHEPTNAEALTATATAIRPDLALLDARAAQLEQQAERVAASRRPQVHFEGAYQLRTNRFQEPDGWSSAAVVGSWQPYSGGRVGHQSDALRALARAAMLRRADLESQIRLAVRRALLDLRETRDRIQVAEKAIQQADENLRVNRRSYQQGVGTSTDVLDAIGLRQQASRRYFDSWYDAIMASVRLHHAVGDL